MRLAASLLALLPPLHPHHRRLTILSTGSASSLCRVRLQTADGVRVLEDVQQGELLRTALLRRGVSPHNGRSTLINCRGLGTCGTCAVEIDGAVTPQSQSLRERARLNFPPHGPPGNANLRLACQCTVEGDLDVRKRDGFWGSGTDLAPAGTGKVTWLGQVEYVLDGTSPPPRPCAVCGGTKLVLCPMCGGADASCRACAGTGQVVCRSCFQGDPWAVDTLRAQRARRPD